MSDTNTRLPEPLVRVDNLSVHFPAKGGGLFGHKKEVKAVSGVTMCIAKGETFGLVGESGCGKSTLANALLGMVKPTGGKVFFKEKDINAVPRKEFTELRREMQMIFQDPYSSLNPRFDVFRIISEPMFIRGGHTEDQMKQRVIELLELVGLSEEDLYRFPSDFSGGQRQRIGIARAISLNPEFLVCDEPVSALDVSVHAQILNLLMELQEKLGMTYLFISHNLAVVKNICTSLAVMYLGNMMEAGDTRAIYKNPVHPYTQSLLSAVLDVDVDNTNQRIILQGDIPSPLDPPAGCRFCTRCPKATEICKTTPCEMTLVEPGHFAACHHLKD